MSAIFYFRMQEFNNTHLFHMHCIFISDAILPRQNKYDVLMVGKSIFDCHIVNVKRKKEALLLERFSYILNYMFGLSNVLFLNSFSNVKVLESSALTLTRNSIFLTRIYLDLFRLPYTQTCTCYLQKDGHKIRVPFYCFAPSFRATSLTLNLNFSQK